MTELKPQRIAVVHDKQQYSEGLARSVQESLKKQGANIVMFEGITSGDKDFSTLSAVTTRRWVRLFARCVLPV